MTNLNHEKFIFDNSTFSNFARIEKLELIFHLTKNLYTTKEVVEEINNGIRRRAGLALSKKLKNIINFIDSGKIEIRVLKKIKSILLMDTIINEGFLGRGEISAMVLAKELNGIFITDDEKAAKKAEQENIRILKAGELNIGVAPKNRLKATVIFLEILKNRKIILPEEFDTIRESLKNENFSF